jgi:diguanylate cyclase (GGDEF)-like protein
MGDAATKLEPRGGADALELFKPFEHFTKCLLDGFVVVDTTGKVLKCNQLFSQLAGQKTKQILKADSLDDLLTMHVAGKPIKVKNILESVAPTRIDEVSGKGADDRLLNLIIGVYPLQQDGTPAGAFVLIRDVTAETNLQDKYKDKATQSITDALTGLFNRAYFVDYMKAQLSSLETLPSDATQRVMSVVMLDIDHFKKINDVYGHQAGDYVIKSVSEIMKKTFRKTDIVCRYGGEEFLAILPGTDGDGACRAAEKIRAAIAGMAFIHDGKTMPVTISSGVAQIDVGKEKGEQTIARADAALYFSKGNGRNRVSWHDGKEPGPPKTL